MSRKSWSTLNADIVACKLCPRLRAHCEKVAEEKRKAFIEEDYWGKPVENFGDWKARLLIVGLAPAAHGANRTGRMFTGDRSGDWLFRALHKSGFANQPESTRTTDGLRLSECAITAACHCAPPGNKPTSQEIANCTIWYQSTINLLKPKVFLALGGIAWNLIFRHAKDVGWHVGKRPKFAHTETVRLQNKSWVLGSYHPSQQNTFTGRLTEPMFDRVFRKARKLLDAND